MHFFDKINFPVVYHTMVEHSAVNRVVVGSSPTWGVQRPLEVVIKDPQTQNLRVFTTAE